MRRRSRATAFIALLGIAAASACSASTSSPEAGGVRQPCYGNGTCNAGLTCASDVCVALGDGGSEGGSTPKNVLCDKPSDCPAPLACASDYRCRSLCATDADCNVLGITGRVCAKDANGVDYCADPNEVMSGMITVAPPMGADDSGTSG